MAKRASRVIIDTNLWISFLITKDLKGIDGGLKTGRVKVIFSIELMEEFLSVANRPKFKKYFSKEDLEKVLDLFDVYGELVPVESELKLCRDPKDNFLLSLALDSKADYLITGDSDILELKRVRNTKIITIVNYLKRIGRHAR